MKKIMFVSLGFAAFLLFAQTKAFACSCIANNPDATLEQKVKEAAANAQAVFSGKVLKITKNPQRFELTVKIRVEKSWKKNLPKEITIKTASEGSLCGVSFETGKSYLVYASENDKNSLTTNLCFRNQELQNAAEEVKILGKIKSQRKRKT